MTLETIAERIESIDQKLDLVIDPIREDMGEVKVKVEDHSKRIGTLEAFKEGHQEAHKAKDKNSDNRQFSISQWVVIGICILTILVEKFI